MVDGRGDGNGCLILLYIISIVMVRGWFRCWMVGEHEV